MRIFFSIIILMCAIAVYSQEIDDPCNIDWLFEPAESDQINVKMNHLISSLVFPSQIRIDFESAVKFDSATITFMNICEQELSNQTSFTTYFNINLESDKFRNLIENRFFFNITGYLEDQSFSSPICGLEMLADERLGAIKYDLRRARHFEDSIYTFNRNLLFLNSHYLKSRK